MHIVKLLTNKNLNKSLIGRILMTYTDRCISDLFCVPQQLPKVCTQICTAHKHSEIWEFHSNKNKIFKIRTLVYMSIQQHLEVKCLTERTVLGY